MSFFMTPSGREGMKKYSWPDFGNTGTVGVEVFDGELCVSYFRPPINHLIRKLLQPAPRAKIHVYQPLPPGCVRLLRRVENAVAADDGSPSMVFDFVICSLDDASKPHPEYSAVSYCWGDLFSRGLAWQT